MNESLEKLRQELSETVLGFVWQQWSSIGVMATGGAERLRVIDPEPLLLLTLEVARQDPRMFDEVLDWLLVNGKWINVLRLSALLAEDKLCAPEVLGAVAARMAQHDKTPKWRNLAKELKPMAGEESKSLFEKNGQPLFLAGSEPDKTFQAYGLLRLPVQTRGLSSPVLSAAVPAWTSANFMFKARALFGVNIRADAFAFLVLHGAANPTWIASELGYSQRRVQDALGDMAAAGIFKVRTTGKAKEYSVDSDSTLRFLGVTEHNISWVDWRALSRAVVTHWRRALSLQAEALTPYILESEWQKMLQDVRNDLLSALPKRPTTVRTESVTREQNRGLLHDLQNMLPTSSGYPWDRMWVPREGTVSFADSGFPYVPKPDNQWPSPIPSDVVPFKSIAKLPCLGLLGEPGMGKSFALRAAAKGVERLVRDAGARMLFLDLRSYGSEDRLIRDLFESETFRGWSRGEYQLHLFLDSLDEALMRQSTIAHVLLANLNDCPSVAGLFLRIACRTAEWPKSLESGFKSKWGDNAVGAYELVPLTRQNVIEAAESETIDSDDFLREVDSRGVVPLAFKPVTLKFLLKTFQKNGRLASSQKDLYLDGCRILCEESDKRIEAGLAGNLLPEQRLQVAAHIAAATVFCNRSAIWTGPNQGLLPDSDLALDELCTGASSENGIPLTRESVMETLDTGLFSSRGPDRLGWAHQTYAEFLAAWFLIHRGMSLGQKLDLLVHPGDSERRLVPQLHEMAAWLASMDIAIFREIAKSDPDVLLQSDVANASDTDREQLVEFLIQQLEAGYLVELDWSRFAHYRKLSHPRLADQLRPFILDHSQSEILRREAINIAEACDLKPMAADLALVALDPSDALSVREKAASFVAKLGNPQLRARLKPLATSPTSADAQDELRGCALKACWPECISAAELFCLITPPRESSTGNYTIFLSSNLVEGLKAADLPIALRWVREQPTKHELPHSYGELLDGILEKAAENLDDPGVVEEFATTVLTRLRKNDELMGPRGGWTELLQGNEATRRRIIEALLPKLSQPREDVAYLTCLGFHLVDANDVPWLVDRLERELRPSVQVVLAHMLWQTANLSDASQADAVIRLSEKYLLVRELFSHYLTPVELGSEQAQKASQDYSKIKDRQVRAAKAREMPVLTPPPAERVLALLEKCEQGEFDSWWRLTVEMTRGSSSTRHDQYQSDLTQLPVWAKAVPETRARIVRAARSHVCGGDSNPDAWFQEQNVWYGPAVAGFQALSLLHKVDPGSIDQLSAQVWKKWIPVILQQPISGDLEVHKFLTTTAYRAVPEETIQWLSRVIDKANKDVAGHLWVLDKVQDILDDKLAGALLVKAKLPALQPKVLRSFLNLLLDHKFGEAREFAATLIQLPLPSDREAREKAIETGEALLSHSPEAWSAVWSAMLGDTGFGRALFERIGYRYYHAPDAFCAKLSADQMADLYMWLLGQFPPGEEPQIERAHAISGPEYVAHFRDSLVTNLRDRGTPEACHAIQRLIRQFPSFKGLRWMFAQAKANMRKNTWQPLTPGELFQLASQRDLRLVRDGEELLTLVVESLERLKKRLQGETPAAEFLWDKVLPKKGDKIPRKRVHRPKDEGALSNFIKLHLETDLKARGIIVNREVEIRRGEETDIHIDAITQERGKTHDRVSVIIEAKGSWNPDLETALESQLVDRYLRDNACQHGIYLVGWFNCSKWDGQDYRKKASLRAETNQVKERLEAKAGELSKCGVRVRALILNAVLR